MNFVRRILFIPIALSLFASVCFAATPNLEIIYPPSSTFECPTSKAPVTGLTSCRDCVLMVGDKIVSIMQDGSFFTEVPLHPGQQTVSVRLTDSLGNTAKQDFEILNVLPAPKNDSPGLLPMIPQGTVPVNTAPPALIPTEKTVRQAPVISHPTQVIRYNNIMNSINIYRNGTLVATFDASSFIIRNNRVFIPADSDFWKKFDVSSDSKSNTLTFHLEDPIQDISLDLDRDVNKPSPLSINGRDYIPVRASFELAGFQVDWASGRIHITGPPCQPSKATVAMENHEVELKGVNLFGTLFIRSSDLKTIGLKVKNVENNLIEVTNSSGEWAKIRILPNKIDITNNSGDTISLDSTKVNRVSLKERFDVPLRGLIASFGYNVKWDSENRNARIYKGAFQKLASKTR